VEGQYDTAWGWTSSKWLRMFQPADGEQRDAPVIAVEGSHVVLARREVWLVHCRSLFDVNRRPRNA
jgi:hypothetical protein